MVIAMLLSLLLAQATTGPKPAPQQPTTTSKPAAQQPATPPKTAAPAPPRTTTPRRPVAAPVAGMAITVTDGKGAPFEDVSVALSGLESRTEKTNAAGQVSFPSLRAGTYRLTFSGEGVVAFEREVAVKAGEIAKLPITLTAAEPPKPPPPAPTPTPVAPPRPVAGPVGEPQLGSLTRIANQEKNAKERREMLLSCSGNTRNTLLVLTGEQPQRIYETAEATYYVISGQGGAIIGKLQSVISEGWFITIPRGTSFTIARQGNRPLTMLFTLSGEPCETAK